MFDEMRFSLDQQEVAEWLNSDINDPGVQIYTDSEICDMVTDEKGEIDSEDEEIEEGLKKEVCPVSNSQAACCFQQCLTWLENQPEATVCNTTLLRELQSLASNKRFESLKQRKVIDYF